MSIDGIPITREDEGNHGKYIATLPGTSARGRLIWVLKDGARVARSTQVPKEIGGRGVAGALVKALVADAEEQGFKIVPACSYVEVAFDRHKEWAHLRA